MEHSFSAFDQAMEDTALALNTGYWRTRDGAVINRSAGKAAVVNPEWRTQLDEVVRSIDGVRALLRSALQLDAMFIERGLRFDRQHLDDFEDRLRVDHDLGAEIDRLRDLAIASLNGALAEIDHPGLAPIRS